MAALTLVLEQSNGEEPWVVEQQIFDIINSYLQPTDGPSASQTAEQISQLFPYHRPSSDVEKEEPASFLYELWGLVLKIAQQIQYQHPGQDKLVVLINTLRDMPSELKVPIWGSESRIWQDLPLLVPNLTEVAHTIGPEDGDRWVNFNAFCARLTRDGTCDRSSHAIWDLREALEEDLDQGEDACEEEKYPDVRISVAANWITIAGDVLYRHSSDCGKGGELGVASQGKLYSGQAGFSLERWAFWKERFGVVKASGNITDGTKQAAEEAEAAMINIEKSS
ncbi:hypothetical protein BZA77DRAFT_391816 [Pyronema omphalodes]|nr:hypothetical protein BZA77DRAFT_391816 [Pyronema omphalodes]